jgi:FtsP/CotA-like multicopper oxidase with cupredoxin domain
MKRALLAVLAAAALVVVGIAGGGAVLYARADTSNLGTLEFENELEIPPLLAPREEHGRLVFDLELRTGRSELVPGQQAETWGADGSYLGPTLRAEHGDRVEVRVRNELPEQTTIHWHGMHLPAVADGGPHQTIAPGETWRPSWEIDQPAATLWYHPIRTVRPPTRSIAESPGCSSSTIRRLTPCRSPIRTASTTSG